jgi:hypothetical protein
MNLLLCAVFGGVDLSRAAASDETTVLHFSPSAGGAGIGSSDSDDGEPLSGCARYPHHAVHVRQWGDHSCAQFDQDFQWERDVEMHPTRKGKQWYYDAKAHIGMNSKEKVVHSVATSATREADVHMLSDPTARGGEEAVGRRGLSRAGKSNRPGCARGAGYDQLANKIQELCEPTSQA